MHLFQKLDGLYIKAQFLLNANYVDAFNKNSAGNYGGGSGMVNNALKNGTTALYSVVWRLGMIASGVAALIAFLMLFYNAQHPQAASESKKKLVRILFCIALLFGIPSFIAALMKVKL